MKVVIILHAALWAVVLADVSHITYNQYEDHAELIETTTPPPPPRPYAFGYAAGRFPGHIDRTHSEISDGSGVVKGSFSYVDPRHQIRIVDYVADKNGFHPVLNNQPNPIPADSPVVAAAKEKHHELYARIANAHAYGSPAAAVPVDSESVARAKVRHYDLFQKIAEQHALIAAEREAIQATAEPNTIDEEHNHTVEKY